MRGRRLATNRRYVNDLLGLPIRELWTADSYVPHGASEGMSLFEQNALQALLMLEGMRVDLGTPATYARRIVLSTSLSL